MSSTLTQYRQAGFTLIELMVVVVILAILLSVATLAFSPSDSAKLNQQAMQFKGALQQACDEAIFSQNVQALVPSKTGISLFSMQQGEWQAATSVRPLNWVPGITVDWQVENQLGIQETLPNPAWLCWPTGEILPGSVTFQLGGQKLSMSWTPLLQFTMKQEHNAIN